jgi:rhomboid family GlyGly-CTERM serine protease
MNASVPSGGSVTAYRRLLKSLNCDGRRGFALLALCALLILPELGGDAARAVLRYERVAVGAGEWWRLVTAHLVHLDLEHAVLNALGLVLMWALFARDYGARAWVAIVVISLLSIDAGFWFRDRGLDWYVGSSGVLHGVMAAGTLAHLLRRDLDGWILAAFMIVKLGYEQASGALPFAEGGAAVIVNSHLYGALGGLIAAMALSLRRRPAAEASL